jgi:hypothetical protein
LTLRLPALLATAASQAAELRRPLLARLALGCSTPGPCL